MCSGEHDLTGINMINFGKRFKILKKKYSERKVQIHALKGGFIGFFFLHPIIILMTNLMNLQISRGKIPLDEVYETLPQLLFSYRAEMIPWAIAFLLFGSSVGFYYGKILANLEEAQLKEKVATKDRELFSLLVNQSNDEIFVINPATVFDTCSK